MAYRSQQLNRVAENLFRDGNNVYVAKLKRGGKIHKRNLDTTDFALAKRKLRDFEDEVERKKASGASKMLFAELTERWRARSSAALLEVRARAYPQIRRFFRNGTGELRRLVVADKSAGTPFNL